MSRDERDTAPAADQPAVGLGELATGSAGRWHVSVVESLDGEKLYLELDGPVAYLCLLLKDLPSVGQLRQFLAERASGEKCVVGRFDDRAAWFVWDNEPEAARCFLVVGTLTETAFRLTLDGEDVRMLREALEQAADDLPESVTAG
jgi:hypothetical protein